MKVKNNKKECIMRECWENIQENWLKNKEGQVKGCNHLYIDIKEDMHRLIHYEKEILRLQAGGIITINIKKNKLTMTDKNYIKAALGITPKQWKQLKIEDNDKTILTSEYLNEVRVRY